MGLVHELKELVHDCLEELPVRLQESGILTDNIHDVGGDDGLIVFSALDLAKTKEIFDDSDEEALLSLLI